jgi:type IV secretory pathway component VirB8
MPIQSKPRAEPRPRGGASAGALTDVPGPYEQAALKIYFERGSKEAVERNTWRAVTVVLACALGLCGLGFWQLIPLKTVETALVSKDSSGRAQVEFAGKAWTPDSEMKAAWLSDWVQALSEVNAATWERSVARAASLSVGTARDQIRDYLQREGNQPVLLLKDKPAYVREYKLTSVNNVNDNVLLLRFTLTSRPNPGANKITVAYAITATLTTVKPETRAQAIDNPSGLVVSNFNITEDNIK